MIGVILMNNLFRPLSFILITQNENVDIPNKNSVDRLQATWKTCTLQSKHKIYKGYIIFSTVNNTTSVHSQVS